MNDWRLDLEKGTIIPTGIINKCPGHILHVMKNGSELTEIRIGHNGRIGILQRSVETRQTEERVKNAGN